MLTISNCPGARPSQPAGHIYLYRTGGTGMQRKIVVIIKNYCWEYQLDVENFVNIAHSAQVFAICN